MQGGALCAQSQTNNPTAAVQKIILTVVFMIPVP